MGTNELAIKVRELKELKLMAEELAVEISSIEDEIKSVMTKQNVDEMTVDVFKIRWTTVISSRLDSSTLKKVMPDLYNQFTKQNESRRFSVV